MCILAHEAHLQCGLSTSAGLLGFRASEACSLPSQVLLLKWAGQLHNDIQMGLQLQARQVYAILGYSRLVGGT